MCVRACVRACVCVCFKGTFIIKFHFLCRQTLLPASWQTRGNKRENECVHMHVCVGYSGQTLGCHVLLLFCLFSPPTAEDSGTSDDILVLDFSLI